MLRTVVLFGWRRDVIDRAAHGAWRELEAKLRPFITRRLHTEADVDDVMQDVFLRMQRGLSGLRDDACFGAWVYQVARSAIVDHQRVAARQRVVAADSDASQLVAADAEDDAAVESVEQLLASCLTPFVAQLPSPYREAITLVELEGLTQKQAAEMIGISLSGMKSRVQRGRVQLRRALEACCHIARDVRGRVVSCESRPHGGCPTQWNTSFPTATGCGSEAVRTHL